MRGELSSSWPFRFNFIGSTPLARGTPVSRCTALTVLRFNPACAGNSCRNNQVPVKDVRFNPACAGNSQTEYLISHWSPVQPRLRGELRATGINIGKPNGSTPLARGTPIPFLLKAICLRFNPACAGNSRRRYEVFVNGTVQPRLRGELDVWHLAQKFDNGSTPLARGTLPSDAGLLCTRAVQPRLRGELLFRSENSG